MPFLRLVQRLGHQAWFARLGKALVPLDRLVARLTKGRVVALGLVPSLILTTVGRRSGQERVQPLVYTKQGNDIILIGSNWGQAQHPAWSANLITQPQARIRINGHERAVTARLVTGHEREQLWQAALRVWPAYATYAKRAHHRQFRIFRLTGSRP